MKTHNRSNALLMELLLVILFFMLASTLLMRFFGGIHSLEARSGLIAAVAAEAQSQADRLYQAEDPEAELVSMGFQPADTEWTYTGEGYRSTVTVTPGEDGWTRRTLTVRDSEGEILITLPCSRWQGVNP